METKFTKGQRVAHLDLPDSRIPGGAQGTVLADAMPGELVRVQFDGIPNKSGAQEDFWLCRESSIELIARATGK